MNEPGTPPPDWNAIFDRAHRRILGRLLLLGGIGAVCAVLLLGSGLSAQGAVRWRIGPFASADATTPAAGKVKIDHKVKKQAAEQARRRHRRHKRRRRHHHHHHHHHPGGGGNENGDGGTEAGCPVGQIDSSNEEYEEEWIITATGRCALVPVEPPEEPSGTEGGGDSGSPQKTPAR